MAEQVVCDWCLGVLKVWVHIVMCRCALVLSVRVNESVCVCVCVYSQGQLKILLTRAVSRGC